MQREAAGTLPGPRARYLVIQLARFGDLIQTKRLLVSLMACGEVHLLVDRSLTALARLAFPGVRVHGIAAHGIHGPAILGLVHDDLQELQAHQFHRIYNLNYSGLNFALASLFPVDQVRGYRLDQGQRVVDAWPAQAMRWTKVRTTRGLNLVDVWGLYADQPVEPERVNPAASAGGIGLGVVMAGQNARRSLPPRVLAPLVHAASKRIGHGPILFLGAGAERRAAAELRAALPGSLRGAVRDLVGKTSWADLFEVVGGLGLLLSPDTGTMHLAAHLGVPVMAFFLSSAWCHETGPYGTGHLVLQAMATCAPCLETGSCPNGVLCRNVFSEPGLLRYVSGQDVAQFPPHVAAMASTVDSLGVCFRPDAGIDPFMEERQSFRAAVARIAGIPGPAPCSVPLDESWIQERDWMLPQTLRGRANE